MPSKDSYQCQVVGGGAAGIGILIALYNAIAANSGETRRSYQLLLDNMLWIEAGSAPGGILGQYQINANTHAADAVASIADGTPLVALRDDYLKIPEVAKILISLPRLNDILIKPLSDKIVELLGDHLVCNQRVARIVGHQRKFSSYDDTGRVIATSRNLIMCCGAKELLLEELQAWKAKVEFGGEFLLRQDIAGLSDTPGPIVVTSASHTGFSCVWRLLNDPLFGVFAKGRDIVILQRRAQVKLRCRLQVAIEYKLEWDEENDVCSKTGRIFANGGLRKDAKHLFLDLRDGREARASIQRIKKISDASPLLDQAALIIQCAGFSANLPEIEIDGEQRSILPRSDSGEAIDAKTGNAIPGLFACGLGMHILPADFPGEKSFTGSINGLQSYPLAIAPGIIQQLVKQQ